MAFVDGVERQIEVNGIVFAYLYASLARHVIRRRVQAIIYVDDVGFGQRLGHRRVDRLAVCQPRVVLVWYYHRAGRPAKLAAGACVRDETGPLAYRDREVARPAVDLLEARQRDHLDVFVGRQRLEQRCVDSLGAIADR